MKENEITSSRVSADYIVANDGDQISKYGPNFDKGKSLSIDLTLI